MAVGVGRRKGWVLYRRSSVWIIGRGVEMGRRREGVGL
jgi:hypothetical protein